MKWWPAFIFIPILISCTTATEETQVEELPKTNLTENWRGTIDSLMTAQERAWNDGNLESFMAPYLQTDSLMFVGKGGLNYGWQTTLSNYQKSYPDKEAMGTLKFENLKFQKLGDQNALIIGRWNLYRTADTLKGSYSLNWQFIDGHWKIIADHSS